MQADAGGDLDEDSLFDMLVASRPSDINKETLVNKFKALRGIRDATTACKV